MGEKKKKLISLGVLAAIIIVFLLDVYCFDGALHIADIFTQEQETVSENSDTAYHFRSDKLLSEHYTKHGVEMGFSSKEEYEAAASAVINNPSALSKTEKEDGDYVYYLKESNEFVILSKDGYIRTYFLPDAGIAYYNKQ